MKYSELDVEKIRDSEIYDLVMSGVRDYSKIPVEEENNPDFLVVLGASPKPMKSRIVKMMHLYKNGYGKYVLLTGGEGWHKLFKPEKRKFKDNVERYEYASGKRRKYRSMRRALRTTMPDEFKNPNKQGKALYRFLHRKIEENLTKSEAEIGYKIIQACKEIVDIDDDKILFEGKSKNTIENVQFSKDIMCSKMPSIKRIMLITSCFHCKRAELTFKKYFPEVEVMTCPSTKDIKERGASLDKETLMSNPYYMGEIKKELNAIVSYSKKGIIADEEIDKSIFDSKENELEEE